MTNPYIADSTPTGEDFDRLLLKNPDAVSDVPLVWEAQFDDLTFYRGSRLQYEYCVVREKGGELTAGAWACGRFSAGEIAHNMIAVGRADAAYIVPCRAVAPLAVWNMDAEGDTP